MKKIYKFINKWLTAIFAIWFIASICQVIFNFAFYFLHYSANSLLIINLTYSSIELLCIVIILYKFVAFRNFIEV